MGQEIVGGFPLSPILGNIQKLFDPHYDQISAILLYFSIFGCVNLHK